MRSCAGAGVFDTSEVFRAGRVSGWAHGPAEPSTGQSTAGQSTAGQSTACQSTAAQSTAAQSSAAQSTAVRSSAAPSTAASRCREVRQSSATGAGKFLVVEPKDPAPTALDTSPATGRAAVGVAPGAGSQYGASASMASRSRASVEVVSGSVAAELTAAAEMR